MAVHDLNEHRKRKEAEQAEFEKQARAQQRKDVFRHPNMKFVYIGAIVLLVVAAGLYFKPADKKAGEIAVRNQMLQSQTAE